MLSHGSEEDIILFKYDDDLIQDVLRCRAPRFRVTVPDYSAVVLGKGGISEVELHLDACKEDGILVLRRPGGGCAVFIDPGNIIISVVLPTNGIRDNHLYFKRLSGWLIGRLEEIGMKGIYSEGISDLALDNRKVSGSSIYRTKDYLYYSATLLIEPRLDLIERYIQYPPREPQYRAGRSHAEFLGRLSRNGVKESSGQIAGMLRNCITREQLT